MLHPSTKKLIDRLSEMTRQRKIDWVGGERPDTLAYDTEGYRVLLEGEPAALVLCDALGNELDRADPDVLAATNHIDGGTYEALMVSMHTEANRIARGTEDAIASVLGGLDLDGDGIPDVPAPIDLEDAPEGPATEAQYETEDTADEMSAYANEAQDPEAASVEIAASEVTPADEDEFVEQTPETPPLETSPSPLMATVTDQHGLEASASETSHIPAQDLTHADAATEDINALSDLSADLQTEALVEDAPYVGKAVADLADKVNNLPPEAETEDITQEPEPASPILKPVNSVLTGGIGFGGFGSSTGFGTGTIELSSAPIKPERKETPIGAQEPGTPEPDLEVQVQDETLAPSLEEEGHQLASLAENMPQPTVPQPGQSLSLSGLVNASSDPVTHSSGGTFNENAGVTAEPVMDTPVADTAQQHAEPETAEPQSADIPPHTEYVEQDAPAAQSVETSTLPPLSLDDHATPAPKEDEPADAEAPPTGPKRFNPWI